MTEARWFRYDAALLDRFPAIRAGIVHATGLANGPSPPALADAFRAEQAAAADRLAATPIAELPSIAAWRRAFTAFGVKPTQYRSAAEALQRRLAKAGDIPSISALVDIGNLVSIRVAMPVAVFDLAAIAAPTTVRFATGEEHFTDLGSSESMHPEPGEVVFADMDCVVSARRWCWRQSAESATGPATTEALFVVEGLHDDAGEQTHAAVTAIEALLATHQPGAAASAYLLSPDRPFV